MTQFEFYKSFVFVIELLLAESMFIFKFNKKNHFVLRIIGAIILVFAFAFLLPAKISDNAFYCSLLFILIFAFTILAAKFIFDVDWKTVLFACFAGYTTQHMTYELYNLTLNLMGYSDTSSFYGTNDWTTLFPNLLVFVVYLVIYVCLYTICYFLFARKIKGKDSIKIENYYMLIFTMFIVIVDVFLNAWIVKNPSSESKVYAYVISILNFICCLVSMFLLFEVIYRNQLQEDYTFMKKMWEKEKEQYILSKNNIEMINMKCHDFKHQIHNIASNKNVSTDVINEIEDKINIYDSFVKTGNEALDIVLAEKSLICNQKHITFTYIADGKNLSFIKEEDIYSLFGNILDNAIEALEKVDKANKVIDLHIKKRNQMIIVRQTNYFPGHLDLVDGLPKTTKKDKDIHGYGVKSIQRICEKYNGSCRFVVENNTFELNIIMFIPKV